MNRIRGKKKVARQTLRALTTVVAGGQLVELPGPSPCWRALGRFRKRTGALISWTTHARPNKTFGGARRKVRSHMKHPMPTIGHLRKAREEFKRIEPRDFFYWSVTKLVAAVLDTDLTTGMVDELVRALMMLLTTWNKNYYRFFESRKGGMTLEEHFAELETVISKHFDRLIEFRNQRIHDTVDIPEQDIRDIFQDFTNVLGRVGAAKCLHLLAPGFFPLWDAAILKGYGMEKANYRHRTDAERYVAFISITKAQIANLGDFSSFSDNPLKSLDEYNYCSFTKKVDFD